MASQTNSGGRSTTISRCTEAMRGSLRVPKMSKCYEVRDDCAVKIVCSSRRLRAAARRADGVTR